MTVFLIEYIGHVVGRFNDPYICGSMDTSFDEVIIVRSRAGRDFNKGSRRILIIMTWDKTWARQNALESDNRRAIQAGMSPMALASVRVFVT